MGWRIFPAQHSTARGTARCVHADATTCFWCACVLVCAQDFRAFNRTGKPRVLIMSYPCFRGHKAEVYKLGIDVLMCDEVCVLSEGDRELQVRGQQFACTVPRHLLVSLTRWTVHAFRLCCCCLLAGTLPEEWRRTDHPGSGRAVDTAQAAHVRCGMRRLRGRAGMCIRSLNAAVRHKALLAASLPAV